MNLKLKSNSIWICNYWNSDSTLFWIDAVRTSFSISVPGRECLQRAEGVRFALGLLCQLCNLCHSIHPIHPKCLVK